ncbi:hypothetical protein JCM10207_004785 [Rhodosporidiobolus poonsookiae]
MPKSTRTSARTSPKKRSASPSASSSSSASPPPADKPESLPASKEVRMSYRIGRGEEGVLTFEPYKSALLPHWRFKTPDIARESSAKLWEEFGRFDDERDFVGMDMTRKFIQMGMTRATRYGRRAGGRKYDKETGELLPQTTDHPGAKEKMESAAVFREVWERCKAHEGYAERRKEWEAEKKAWEKEQKGGEPSKKRRKTKNEDEEE